MASQFEPGSDSEKLMKKLEVPYIHQINKNACGAAVLEMVYQYYGLKDFSQQDLMSKYQQLESHGSGNFQLTTDTLVFDARSRGFNAGWIRANWINPTDSISLLQMLINAGIPIIVCQTFTNDQPLIGHFRIVLGIDESKVYLHDPNLEIGGSNIEWSIEKFLYFWRQTGNNVTGGILIFINK